LAHNLDIRTSYLRPIYDPELYIETVDQLVTYCKGFADEFDAVAFTGTSGAAVGYILATFLHKPVICVRKRAEKNHSPYVVEGYYGSKNYLIVDDLIGSGDTMCRIVKEIDAAYAPQERPAPRHIVLYADPFGVPSEYAEKLSHKTNGERFAQTKIHVLPEGQVRKTHMALNLDDEKAVDYSSNTPLLPFDSFGNYDLAVIGYIELVSEDELELRRREFAIQIGARPEEVSDEQLPKVAYNGSCDIATVKVLASDNAEIRVGDTYALYFDTHAVGDSKAYAAARLRGFVAAACGVQNPKGDFKANAARRALLDTDLSGGDAHVHLWRKSKPGKGEYEGREFNVDRYSPID
jgi:hypothetical protein